MTGIVHDLRYGARLLRRSPVFALTASLSLAIGIGANTAIFTVANALLLRDPVGVIEPGRLVDIGTARGDGGLNPVGYATYLEVQRRTSTLSSVYAYHMFPSAMSLGVPGAPGGVERVFGHSVTTNFFSTLGAGPVVGRVFTEGDGFQNTGDSAVLSYGFWTRRFGADPAIVGRTIRLNGRMVTIVGVAPERFQGTGIVSPDMWLPLSSRGRTQGAVIVGGRLKPGIPTSQSAAEMATISQTLDREEARQVGTRRLGLLSSSRAAGNRNVVAGFAMGLMILVSLVLAVACANVAGILVARATTRRREMAVRTAIGAARGRLVRQLLAETVMLFAVGGVFGVVSARVLLSAVSLLPALPMPIVVSLPIDLRVIGFTMAVSFVAAVVSSLAPAIRASHVNPLTALKEGAETSPSGSRLRSMFVMAQVAISVVLIVTAGLFVRAMQHAGSTDPGFESQGVEVARLDLSMGAYVDSTRSRFWRELLDRVRQMPHVEAATLARVVPGGFEGISLGDVRAVGGTASDVAPIFPSWNIVAPGYFATLRIPLVAGRDFHADDVDGSQAVAIVGEDLARRLWPGQSAVGQQLSQPLFRAAAGSAGRPELGGRRELLVVGIARDVKSSSFIDGLADSFVYVPLQQNNTATFTTQMSIVTRAAPGRRVAPDIRSQVANVDPNLVVVTSQTLEDSVALGLAPHRLIVSVAGSLGVIGLLLATIGIYGVVAYTVACRTRNIGVRIALGARPRDIAAMVLGQGLAVTAIGSLIGLLLAAGVSHVLAVFLFGLAPFHAPTFIGAAGLFIGVALIASYVPARRAARVDPLVALRYE